MKKQLSLQLLLPAMALCGPDPGASTAAGAAQELPDVEHGDAGVVEHGSTSRARRSPFVPLP